MRMPVEPVWSVPLVLAALVQTVTGRGLAGCEAGVAAQAGNGVWRRREVEVACLERDGLYVPESAECVPGLQEGPKF